MTFLVTSSSLPRYGRPLTIASARAAPIPGSASSSSFVAELMSTRAALGAAAGLAGAAAGARAGLAGAAGGARAGPDGAAVCAASGVAARSPTRQATGKRIARMIISSRERADNAKLAPPFEPALNASAAAQQGPAGRQALSAGVAGAQSQTCTRRMKTWPQPSTTRRLTQ